MPEPEEQHKAGMVPLVNHRAWQRVVEMYEQGDLEALSKLARREEIIDLIIQREKTLLRMIRREETFEALGNFGGFIKTVVGWMVVVGGGIVALKLWVDGYIVKLGSGN